MKKLRGILQILVSIVGTAIVGSFLYHTIEGERGWVAMVRLKNKVVEAEQKLEGLKKEHKDLDHRVNLLRSNNLDPDLLDEEARKTLNYSKQNETVILTPQQDKH
ncbi:MAG: septum formation initiator family protein [Alphaproteobacteria bacterium]|nr:septum formation initiator family protein [Alphaproteobacteria bacterium]MBV8549490.1 septum formation initiator family protein [Alphaproteobacteria bacterium]